MAKRRQTYDKFRKERARTEKRTMKAEKRAERQARRDQGLPPIEAEPPPDQDGPAAPAVAPGPPEPLLPPRPPAISEADGS